MIVEVDVQAGIDAMHRFCIYLFVCFYFTNVIIDLSFYQLYRVKSATPGSSVNLDVLKFDSTKEFSFHWTKLDGSRRSSVGELSFRRVKEEDFGHYLCDVKKEGKVVFTTYRTLFRSKLPPV